MSREEVRIVRLEPMRVASFAAFGPAPEQIAWENLRNWAEPRGYLNNPTRRIFGFNNPEPTPASPNYGYEFWVTLDEVHEATETKLEIKSFAGGLYAVMRCPVLDQDAYDIIPSTWRRLLTWKEDSAYQSGGQQWLEEHLQVPGLPENQFILDLYLPLAG